MTTENEARAEARRIAGIIRDNTRAEAARILGVCPRSIVRWAEKLADADYDIGEPRKGGRPSFSIPPNTEEVDP